MVKLADKYAWRKGEPPPLIEPHSQVKHQVLSKYISNYIHVLMANVNIEKLTFSVVDGFAGGGEYRQAEGGICDGSPLVCIDAARHAEIALNDGRNKPRVIDTRFYFVEKKASTFDYLQARLAARGELHRGQVELLKGDFSQRADQVIDMIKGRRGGERALFILDQYAYRDVPMNIIRRIFARVAKAEVLLTFNVDSMITFLTDDPMRRKTLEDIGLAKYIDWSLLNEVSKSRTPNWRVLIQKMLGRGIIEESGARFGTIFFIRPLGHTSWSYWLVHLSRVFKARDVMMGIHWGLANQFLHELEPDIYTLGFDASYDSDATRQKFLDFGADFTFGNKEKLQCHDGLTEKLPRRLCDDGNPVLFGQLLNDLGNNTPATGEMIRNALQPSISCREIEVFGVNQERRRKATAIQPSDIIVPTRQLRLFL